MALVPLGGLGDSRSHRPGGAAFAIGDQAFQFGGFCLGWDRCAHRPGVVVSDTILFASGFAYWAMSDHLDVWPHELSRTGLPAPAQRELLQRLAWAIGRRTRCFPDPPLAFVERMKGLLLSAFSPQKGPLAVANVPDEASEILSRSRAWELAYFALPTLDADRRPLHDLHSMLADFFLYDGSERFPPDHSTPLVGGLFGMVNRVVSLKMQANKWPLEASLDMDHDCQVYISALSLNIEDDQRRSRRQ